MAALNNNNDNPFLDPSVQPSERRSDDSDESTLKLGRHASLTLGTDSLIILDEALTPATTRDCCGLLPNKKKAPTRAIPFFNVLWAGLKAFCFTIDYAQVIAKDVVKPTTLSYHVEKSELAAVRQWSERLLSRAYKSSQRQKRIKLLINPFGGSGKAEKIYTQEISPVFAAAQCLIDVERTQFSGHAVEIAERLDIDAFDVVASCSGDGLPHEVFNGFAKKEDAGRALAKVAVVQLPCGSGNAMSLNLNGTDSPSLAALCVVKGIRTPLDLISVTQADRRTLSFLSQAVGIVAEVDLGTENLRWMGPARFTYGFLIRLLRKTIWPCDIAVSLVDGDKASIKQRYQRHVTSASKERTLTPAEPSGAISNGLPPLRYGTVNDPLPPDWTLTPYPNLGNFYAGNMSFMAASSNFFQAALPSDGCLDLICIDGNGSRRASIKLLLSVSSGKLFDMSQVTYRKVDGYRVVPKPLGTRKIEYIDIDGESVPFEPFQVEVHRGLGTVLSRNGRLYETPPWT